MDKIAAFYSLFTKHELVGPNQGGLSPDDLTDVNAGSHRLPLDYRHMW